MILAWVKELVQLALRKSEFIMILALVKELVQLALRKSEFIMIQPALRSKLILVWVLELV